MDGEIAEARLQRDAAKKLSPSLLPIATLAVGKPLGAACLFLNLLTLRILSRVFGQTLRSRVSSSIRIPKPPMPAS